MMIRNLILSDRRLFAPDGGEGAAADGGAGAAAGADGAAAVAGASADAAAALGAASLITGAPGADGAAGASGAGDAAGAEGAAAGDGEAADGEKLPLAGAPEAYELKMPGGVTLDEAAWKIAEPVFKKANLGPEQAQALAELFPTLVSNLEERGQARTLAQVVDIRKQWATETTNDPEIGGAKFGENQAVVAKARDTFGTPGLKKLLDETGIGNHIEAFRFFLNVGRGISEGAIHTGGADKATPMGPAEILYPAKT